MEWKGKRVLVLDASSRQILPILKQLYDLKCESSVLYNSKLDNGYVSRYATRRVKFFLKNKDSYIDAVIQEAKTGYYDVILPLSDYTMDMLTRNIEKLSPYVHIPIPERNVFLKAYDKQQTMEICMDNGIPCPITKREDEDLDAFVKRIGFPIIGKPRMANGSRGLKIIKQKELLDELIRKKVIQLEDYVIQEFIPQTGEQFNIHLFMDDDGTLASNLVTKKARWYPIDGGASCLCMTQWNQTIAKDCERLLKALTWRSYCEIEMIVDPRDSIAKVMEINGRASASIKIMELAGINVAKQMLELAMNEPVTRYYGARDDIRLRCFITDVLWLLQSPDRFSRKPNWFSPIRTHDAIFRWADPLPFFAYIIRKVPNYRLEMNKRKRN